jgi:predicted O-linked N-acetylglucosamine transferase (SPINDLY family)
LTDPYLDPPGSSDQFYSERSVRLADSFWCYRPIRHDAAVSPLPALESGFVTFGYLGAFGKVNAMMLDLWARVLCKVQRSRLLLLCRPGSARQRTARYLSHHGVQPDRVEFIDYQPREQYLKTYNRLDIVLDSFPYNGHTTSLDALWMGVPVISLFGRTPVSRAGLSQLSNLGLGDLATPDPDRFVDLATSLASELPRLAELRATLRSRMKRSPLMNGKRFAENIETAYRSMWRQWCESRPT